MLNFGKEEFYTIDFDEFDKMVNDFYSCKCSEFAPDNETLNDTCYEFFIKNEPTEHDKQSLINWIKIKRGETSALELRKMHQQFYGYHVYPNVYLEDMASKGHIPFGRYLVRVCW